MLQEKDLQKIWDKMSLYYQEKYGKSLMFYEGTVHLKLFGNMKEKQLLDLGCGGGQTSIFFAQQGAIVTGVDFSKKQIEFAKALAKERGTKVSFLQGNIENLSMFEDLSYDLINSSHVLHYIEKLQLCFNEIFRVLKPAGKFVFSISHPFNHIVETQKNQLVVRRSYFKKGKYEWNWEYPEQELKCPMQLFIRKVSDYFTALRKTGFVVEDMVEPKTNLDKNSPWCDQLDLNEELVPGVLIFGARKPQKINKKAGILYNSLL